MKTQSPQFLKRTKFLLILPLLASPFIVLGFIALGGGTGKKVNTVQQQGLNTQLPNAKLSGDPSDKMSLYNKAAQDSLDKRRSDGNPLYKADSITALPGDSSYRGKIYRTDTYPSGGSGISPYQDPNELKVKDRLARLEEALNRPVASAQAPAYPQGNLAGSTGNPDIERLEQLMHNAGNNNGSADPETQQLNELMDKLMDLQYPDRAQQKLKEESRKNKGRVYSVSTSSNEKDVSILQRSETTSQSSGPVKSLLDANGFYDINGDVTSDTGQTAVPAVVHETQTLVSGSTIKMRLSEPIFINGTQITKALNFDIKKSAKTKRKGRGI